MMKWCVKTCLFSCKFLQRKLGLKVRRGCVNIYIGVLLLVFHGLEVLVNSGKDFKKEKVINSFKSFSLWMKTLLVYKFSGVKERDSLWSQVSNESRFHPETALPKALAMLDVGVNFSLKEYSLTDFSILLSEKKFIPLLSMIMRNIDITQYLSKEDGEGRTPAIVACQWQNHEGLALIANGSPFCTSKGEGEELLSPLISSCLSLDPKCVDICLQWINGFELHDQIKHALQQAQKGLIHCQGRELSGLASTTDMQGSGLYKSSAESRSEKIASAMASKFIELIGVEAVSNSLNDITEKGLVFDVFRASLESMMINAECGKCCYTDAKKSRL